MLSHPHVLLGSLAQPGAELVRDSAFRGAVVGWGVGAGGSWLQIGSVPATCGVNQGMEEEFFLLSANLPLQ